MESENSYLRLLKFKKQQQTNGLVSILITQVFLTSLIVSQRTNSPHCSDKITKIKIKIPFQKKQYKF